MPLSNNTHPQPINSRKIPLVTSTEFGTTKSIINIEGLSQGERIGVILLLISGSVLQAFANKALEAIIVAFIFLFAGTLVVAVFFKRRKAEMRAFLLMFSVCVFVGGLAQTYSLAVFNKIQSTVDASGFFWRISPQPPFKTLATVPLGPSPLAIVFWQQAYKLTWWLGYKFVPNTGVMFNAMVMGFVDSLTVQIARDLFGEDVWRLRRVGTVAAANGLFILFGAVLLRDCFTTFFCTLLLWGIIRWLVRPKFSTLLFAVALTRISAWAFPLLRTESIWLIAIYWFLAFLFWLYNRIGSLTWIVTPLLIVTFVLVGGTIFANYIQDIQVIQARELEKYLSLAKRTHEATSLGILFVTNQPLPIRIFTGTVYLMISPIPLWAHFKLSSLDYHWIKGYNGIYQLIVLPLVFLGSFTIFRIFRRDREQAIVLLFLLLFLIVNTVGVLVTSAEQRHIGQFLAAMVILAALPDTRGINTRGELRKISIYWIFGVLLVHVAYTLLKIVQ